jgi:hypothetical protein
VGQIFKNLRIEKIYIATHKHDLRLARICVASIRYWYPDIPIYLIKDYFSGDFSTEELERVWSVGVFETMHRFFGWGLSKLEPVFTEIGKRFLILDSDTVFTGRVLDWLEEYTDDFVVHLETQPAQRLNEIYFDLDKLREFDPKFRFPDRTFNTGQYVATGGLLKREDFDTVNWTSIPPSLKYPQIFKNGDQGVLNYVLLKKVALGQVSVAGVPFMKWPMEDISDIDLAQLAGDSPYPYVIHWAGLRLPKIGDMIRSDILLFFEDYYYSRIPLGKIRNRYRMAADFLARLSAKARGKSSSARTKFTKRTPLQSRPQPSAEAQTEISVSHN